MCVCAEGYRGLRNPKGAGNPSNPMVDELVGNWWETSANGVKTHGFQLFPNRKNTSIH